MTLRLVVDAMTRLAEELVGKFWREGYGVPEGSSGPIGFRTISAAGSGIRQELLPDCFERSVLSESRLDANGRATFTDTINEVPTKPVVDGAVRGVVAVRSSASLVLDSSAPESSVLSRGIPARTATTTLGVAGVRPVLAHAPILGLIAGGG